MWSGLTIKEQGPRAIIPASNPNYALLTYEDSQRMPVLKVKQGSKKRFTLDKFHVGCLWDTAKAISNGWNITQAMEDGDPSAGRPSNDGPYFPGAECTVMLSCEGFGRTRTTRISWEPTKTWKSVTMAQIKLGVEFAGMDYCHLRVVESAVLKEEVIVAVDSFEYSVIDDIGIQQVSSF